MDEQQIKALIDAMASSDLAEMEFRQADWTLRLVRRHDPSKAAVGGADASALVPASPTVPVTSEAQNLLCAPLHGVVYLQAAPAEPPYVTAGQSVRSGQVVCVVEAMKVFNEVHAPHDGQVASILVTSGQEVEAGQALLRFA